MRRSSMPGQSEEATEVLDAAYDDLADFAFRYGTGFTNHGPMAVEALVTLGRADAVPKWVEAYRDRLRPAAMASTPIDPNQVWR